MKRLPAILCALFLFAAPANASHITLLEQAAEQGSVDAQRELGDKYYLRQNAVTQAAKWYRKAAEQGDVESQRLLAAFYEQGKGLPQDFNEAYFWYGVSKTNWKQNAVGLHLVPEQRAAVEKRIQAWKPAPLLEPAWWVRLKADRVKFRKTRFEGQDLSAFERSAQTIGLRRMYEEIPKEKPYWFKPGTVGLARYNYEDVTERGIQVEYDKDRKSCGFHTGGQYIRAS